MSGELRISSISRVDSWRQLHSLQTCGRSHLWLLLSSSLPRQGLLLLLRSCLLLEELLLRNSLSRHVWRRLTGWSTLKVDRWRRHVELGRRAANLRNPKDSVFVALERLEFCHRQTAERIAV